MNDKSVFLKLTGAIALSGKLVKAGTLVELDNATASNLLGRGKAVLATTPNAPAAEASAVNEIAAMVTLADGVEISMAEVVKAAQTDAQLTAKKWKALPVEEQEMFIGATIERLKAEAAPATE